MVFPWAWERSCKILHSSINPMPSYPPMVSHLVLSRNNWHTSLYKFRAYCMMVWFTYIMKSLWFIIFSYYKSFCQVCCNWRSLCAGVMEDKKRWSKMTNDLKFFFNWSRVNLQYCVSQVCSKVIWLPVHVYVYVYIHLKFFSIIVYYKILNIPPCAIQ